MRLLNFNSAKFEAARRGTRREILIVQRLVASVTDPAPTIPKHPSSNHDSTRIDFDLATPPSQYFPRDPRREGTYGESRKKRDTIRSHRGKR